MNKPNPSRMFSVSHPPFERHPRPLWPLRHLIRVMRKHDLTNKDKNKYNGKYIKRTQRSLKLSTLNLKFKTPLCLTATNASGAAKPSGFWRGISELPIQRTSSPDPKQLLWFYDFSCDELISNDWLQEQIKRSIKTCLAELWMSLMRNNILGQKSEKSYDFIGQNMRFEFENTIHISSSGWKSHRIFEMGQF